MNFFVDDGVYLGQKANGLIGPVMHHGIKNAHDVEHHYYQPLGFRVLARSFMIFRDLSPRVELYGFLMCLQYLGLFAIQWGKVCGNYVDSQLMAGVQSVTRLDSHVG